MKTSYWGRVFALNCAFLCVFLLSPVPSYASNVKLLAKDHYLDGVSALKLGQNGQAVLALQRALAINPELGAARAALAEAYMNLGDVAAASRLYNQVAQSPSTPAPLAQSFANAATTLDTLLRGGPEVTTYSLAVGFGYDSNANAAQADDQITIPALAAFGPATLSDSAQSQDSIFQDINLTRTSFTPRSVNLATFSSWQGSLRRNVNDDVQSINSLAFDYGVQYRTAEMGTFGIVSQAQQSLLSRSSYRRAATLAAQWQKDLAPNVTFGLNGSYGLISFESENRDMTRGVVGAQLSRKFDFQYVPRVTFGAYTGSESANEQSFNYFDQKFYGVNIASEISPLDDLLLGAVAGFERRDFDQDYPLFFKPRDEEELNLTARAAYRIAPHVTLEPSLKYTRNDSDVNLFTYDRYVSHIAMRWRF